MVMTPRLLVWDNDASTFKEVSKGTSQFPCFSFNKFTLEPCLVLWKKIIVYCTLILLHSSAFMLCSVKQESSLKVMVMILPLSSSGPLKAQNVNLSTTKSNYIHCMPTGTRLPRFSHKKMFLVFGNSPVSEWMTLIDIIPTLFQAHKVCFNL